MTARPRCETEMIASAPISRPAKRWASPQSFNASAAADALKGQPVSVESAQRVASAALSAAKPLRQNGYKVQLAQVAVKRAILTAGGAA